MKPYCCLTTLFVLLVTAVSAQAQIAESIPYQGLLSSQDGHPVADGSYHLTFRLYDKDLGGEALWQEEQEVSVADGLFAAELGVVELLDVPVGHWYRLSVEGTSADGVSVTLAADDGVVIMKAGSPSTTNMSALSNGIEMRGAEGHGLYVGRGDHDGVHVFSSGNDGVEVKRAGSPSTSSSNGLNNGFEVGGAEGHGLSIGRADEAGVFVFSAGHDGVLVRQADSPSATFSSAWSNGIEVQGAEGEGLFVGRADRNGLRVKSAGADGVQVGEAGNPSLAVTNSESDGIEVGGAEGNGLFVGQADENGVNVNLAGRNGVYVNSADLEGVRINSAGRHGIVIEEAGEIGIFIYGTTNEAARFEREIDAIAGLRNHVVLIENTAPTTTHGPDVLALKSSANPAAGGTNFITFFNGGDTAIGAVEGDGSGGVTYKTGSGDFAEYLLRLHTAETLEAGDLVGVFAGRITKTTAGASRLMVLTDRPAVLGNMPPDEDAAGYEAVAFVGQVDVKVRGPVEAGDWLVASGQGDGTAVAVSPGLWRPWMHGPVVGRAWQRIQGEGGHRVRALVGLDGVGDVTPLLAQQQGDLVRQQAELERLQGEVSRLRALIERLLPEASPSPDQ